MADRSGHMPCGLDLCQDRCESTGHIGRGTAEFRTGTRPEQIGWKHSRSSKPVRAPQSRSPSWPLSSVIPTVRGDSPLSKETL